MFTGIVECIGTVLENNPYDDSESGGQGVSITIGNAGVFSPIVTLEIQ